MSAFAEAVVVIGAAGGIGSHVAASFVDRGLTVIGIDTHSLEAARALGILDGEHPAAASGRYEHLALDAGSDAAQALHAVAERTRVRHVVTTAGGATPAETQAPDVLDLSPSTFAQSMHANLVSQFEIAQAALVHLRQVDGDRSLTFTSSINALDGVGLPAYSSAKAALIALTRNLAVAEGPAGIRVNVVAPGTVVTPRTLNLYRHNPAHFEALAATTALGRTATSAEVAATYTALALDLTAITGQAVVVDAGQLARWR